MRTLFEHRYRFPRGKLLVVGLLCLALGIGSAILLSVKGMDARPRKLEFLYELWPLGAVILQWIFAAVLAGIGGLVLWQLNSDWADQKMLIRVTDSDVAWRPHHLAGATVTVPLSQVVSVERRSVGRDLQLVVKSQQDEIILSRFVVGRAKFEEFAAALEKALEQARGGGSLEAAP